MFELFVIHLLHCIQWENLLVVHIPGIEWCVLGTDRDTSSPSPSCRTHTYVTGTRGRQRLKWPSACPPYELSVRHGEHLLFENASINKLSQHIVNTWCLWTSWEHWWWITCESLHTDFQSTIITTIWLLSLLFINDLVF